MRASGDAPGGEEQIRANATIRVCGDSPTGITFTYHPQATHTQCVRGWGGRYEKVNGYKTNTKTFINQAPDHPQSSFWVQTGWKTRQHAF